MWGWIALGLAVAAGLLVTVLVVRKLDVKEIKNQLISRNLSKAVIGYIEAGSVNKVHVGLLDDEGQVEEEIEYHADELGWGIQEGKVIKVGLFG